MIEPTYTPIDKITDNSSVLEKEIWNKAIEAAASLTNKLTTEQRNSIRKLKK